MASAATRHQDFSLVVTALEILLAAEALEGDPEISLPPNLAADVLEFLLSRAQVRPSVESNSAVRAAEAAPDRGSSKRGRIADTDSSSSSEAELKARGTQTGKTPVGSGSKQKSVPVKKTATTPGKPSALPREEAKETRGVVKKKTGQVAEKLSRPPIISALNLSLGDSDVGEEIRSRSRSSSDPASG